MAMPMTTLSSGKATPVAVQPLRPGVLLALFILALFSAYLVTATLVTDRISPPIFFTIALCLTVAPFHPTLIVATCSIAAVIFGDLIFALDHIHGECWYDVLWGGTSWHGARLGGLAYYRQCSQPGVAFWLFVVIGVLWAYVLLVEGWKLYRTSDNRIELSLDEEQPDREQ